MGQVDRGLGFSDIDFAPSAERLGKHEIRRATPALVLIVVALGLTRLHSLGIARLGDQLGRLLIKTDNGAFGVVGTAINRKRPPHLPQRNSPMQACRFFKEKRDGGTARSETLAGAG